MTDHFIDIRLNEGGYVTAEWKCEADDTADCRNHCPDPECCEGCTDLNHQQQWIPNIDPTNNKSYCGKIIWMEEGGTWDEMYCGPDADVRSGPIELVWHDSGYGWRYLGDEAR